MIFIVGTFILGIANPLLQIYKRNSIEDHLDLISIKNGNKFFRYYFMETFFNAFNIDGNTFLTIFFYAILLYKYDN